MRVAIGLGIAAIALAGARVAREAAAAERPPAIADEPYAPSPTAAPILALGYRELAADLLWIRMTGYFGGRESTATGVAALVEAIVALDPRYHRIYDYGANAITIASFGVTQAAFQRALAVLDRGMREFPDDWKLPYLAGEIYTQDLVTSDPAQRRAWDDKGTLLTEAAIRKPGAPINAATWVATMRTKLGQHQRAIDGLQEMLLVTRDADARQKLAEKLAALEHTDLAELNAEIDEAHRRFDSAWQRDHPGVPPTEYVLLGPPPAPGFDLGDLATGGHDVVGSEDVEKLAPVD